MAKSEKRIRNTIYLMNTITDLYTSKHKIELGEFFELDNKIKLLKYVQECPDIFDGLPNEEMMEIVEEIVNERKANITYG